MVIRKISDVVRSWVLATKKKKKSKHGAPSHYKILRDALDTEMNEGSDELLTFIEWPLGHPLRVMR